MLGRSIFIALLALALKLEAVLATVDKEAESSYIRANKRKEEATTLAHSVPETPTGRERKLKGRRSSTGSKSPSSKGPKSGKDSSKGPKSTSSKGPKSAKGLAEGSKVRFMVDSSVIYSRKCVHHMKLTEPLGTALFVSAKRSTGVHSRDDGGAGAVSSLKSVLQHTGAPSKIRTIDWGNRKDWSKRGRSPLRHVYRRSRRHI